MEDPDRKLRELEERWKETGNFADEQRWLEQRCRLGRARHVFLDPDGTIGPFLVVVIRAPTGIVYATQCAGHWCQIRLVEGYLIPLGGRKMSDDDARPTSREFTDVFHEGDGCVWGAAHPLPEQRMLQLQAALADVPCWRTQVDVDGRDVRGPLRLDEQRIADIAEGWIPVETLIGAGVLIWDNCD
jgi:hypothetical protein